LLLSAASGHAQAPVTEFQSISRFVVDNPVLPTEQLERGEVVEGAIAGPEVRRFAIDLEAGDFAAVRLDQTGGDLVLNLFDPDGKLLEIVDQNSLHETETGIIVAPAAGRYTIQIAQFDWQGRVAAFAVTLARREPVGATPHARADQLMETWYDPGHPGAAVAVLQDGRIVYQRALGLADVEHATPITERTPFELASVSKQFTGYAVAMLIAQGRLSRDDEARRYLPELAGIGAPITVGQLLDHSSGLRDWDAGLAIAGLTPEQGMTTQAVLAFVSRQRSLNFFPGSDQVYSNTGYVLLGEIVTRVTGQPVDVWMRQNLFGPLGMADSRLNLDPRATIPGRALSYEGRSPVISLASAAPSAIGGSTSVVSSLVDLERWLANLERGTVGGPAVLALQAIPATMADGRSTHYAYGLWHNEHRGLRSIGHLGLVTGYRTRLAWFPDQKAAVLFLANDGDDAGYARSERIEELFLPVQGRSAVEVPTDGPPELAPALPAVDLRDFVGTYWSDEMATGYEVGLSGESLVASHPLNGLVMLQRTGADAFASGRWYMPELAFTRDPDGKVTGFVTGTDNARHMAFRRIN
jgi:CubicO group peptidase (beta-lactamase class C family)